jgi:hypothetical protein
LVFLNIINGTHELLVYADDVNLLKDNLDNIKKITETLIDTSKEVGLEVLTQKNKLYVAVPSTECRAKS